jgi:outer membrane protein TolC
VLAEIDGAEQDARRAREAVKAEIGLVVNASWQGEDASDWVAREELLTEQRAGAEAAVVWKQPLGRRGEKAAWRAAAAEAEALRQDLEAVRLRVARELAAARSAFEAARERLGLAEDAVRGAQATLAAEAERFRLGEGRSRNVLDAQTDLTQAVRRRNLAARALLTAWADGMYAAGYGGWRPAGDGDARPGREGGE